MRFLTTWILSWILLGLLNIPLYDCIDITLKAYIGATGSIAWFGAIVFDGIMEIIIEIRNNGKG